jgi:septum formation protein
VRAPFFIDKIPDTFIPSPARLVMVLSRQKANSVLVRAGELIISMDTIVVQGGWVMGKPRNRREAFTMLKALSGKWHSVYTGAALRDGPSIRTGWCRSRVKFRPLAEREIWNYIATGEPMDKAGAYGVQERGAWLVEKISGCYFNVVGFPVNLTYRMLKPYIISG